MTEENQAGPTAREKIQRFRSINLSEVSVPFLFGKASGSYIFDQNGEAKLDFTSGYGVATTGWMHPDVITAIKKQLELATFAPPWLATEQALELSELLLSIAPPGMSACLRATGGAEAIEGVLRAVFMLTGKRELASFARSYHGGTGRAIRLSDHEAFHLPELPRNSFTYHLVPPPHPSQCSGCEAGQSCRLACLDQVSDLFTRNPNIAAFIAEPVLGSGGVIVPPSTYLPKLEALCRENGVLFILDEVITGFGRLGSMTAAERFGLHPDALVLAKGMGGGYQPIGAAVLSKALTEALRKYEDVTPTFAWTPLACTAALANIEVIRKYRLVENAQTLGDYLQKRVSDLFHSCLPEQTAEVRGLGLMIGVELVQDAASRKPATRLVQKLLLALFKEGLMCCADWDSHTLILMPPLTISRQEIEKGLDIMEKVVRRWKSKKPVTPFYPDGTPTIL